MSRMSPRTALTTGGIGMAMLLTACGSGGSGSASSSDGSPMRTGAATSSSQVESPSSPATRSSPTSQSSTMTAPPTSRATPTTTPSSSSDGGSTAGSKTAKPPVADGKSNSPGDKPVALCTVKQLRITVAGGNADMQGAHRSLRFTNTSNKVCKLTGAPGVSYVAGSKGTQVGPAAKRVVGHQPIVLIPDATASAGLFISSAPQKSSCAKTSVRGLRVYPPDSYQAAFVPMTGVTCASAKSGPYLRVGPILPGPNNTV